jgi:hypothetical protein
MLTKNERERLIALFIAENPCPDPTDIQTGTYKAIVELIAAGKGKNTTGGMVELFALGKLN